MPAEFRHPLMPGPPPPKPLVSSAPQEAAMSANNLFIRFRNGGSAEYFVEAKSNLEAFLSDY